MQREKLVIRDHAQNTLFLFDQNGDQLDYHFCAFCGKSEKCSDSYHTPCMFNELQGMHYKCDADHREHFKNWKHFESD